ncbi:MAG: gliding motility-associated C-terminal domain-containing protein [Lewinellaceae bacterium]|nr:gliding motility-associated C-terminal domain-containing protein [Lewinellaceae bacterium]
MLNLNHRPMKTPLAFTICALLCLSFYQLQQSPAPESADAFCSQAELHRQKMQADAAYRQASLRMEEQLYALAQEATAQRGPLAQYTLPVVVHIIHNGGSENISDALVANAIQHLNDAFANVGYYNPATGVDTEISFCLAVRDPQGNATTGVNRVQSALTGLNSSTDDQNLKDLSRWDPTQYINVWVVKEICNNNGCGVAGYAYLPGAHGRTYDGIVLEAAYMGSNPTNSTVLIHEMGHYLGLYHTFEGGCPNDDCQQQGDRVCDTPPDNTTARTPCPADMNSCSTDEDDTSVNNPFRPIAMGGLGDQVDMKENYMDYSRFECYDRFSQGQKERMLSVVETIRFSLLDSPACIDPCPVPVGVGFSASALSVPIGSTVDFTNTSTNADSYEWTIDGAAFSTAANAGYTFNSEGSFLVTLTAFSNLSNCLPRDSSVAIEVFCPVMAGFSPGDTSILAGASVSFTNTSSNATSYTWLVNGTAVSNSPDFTLNTTAPGPYNVCLRAEGAFCESLECGFVEATSPDNGCGGSTFFYNLGEEDILETSGCLIPATDGGFYLGGRRSNQSLLIKFDAEGNILWQKAFSFFPNSSEQVIALLEDGQYLVGSSILNDNDQYCFKYDMDTESFVWLRSITNPENNRTFDLLNVENSPNYTLIGYMAVTGGQGCDATWGELDKNTGNVVQLKKYHLGSCETGQDAVLVNDKIYMTGRYNAVNGGQAYMRPAITELELDGTDNWTRLYLVNTNTTARLYSNSILEDNGSLVVCGFGDLAGTSTNSVVGHVFKTRLNGAIDWATAFDIVGGDTERFTTIVDQGDGYLAIGYFNSFADGGTHLCLVKVDKSGSLMWAKYLNTGFRELPYIKDAFARDGYAYIAASTNGGTRNILLFRVSPLGEMDTECASLEPLQVESWQLENPFDGFFTLSQSPFTPDDAAGQTSPADANLPVAMACNNPCEEICINGIDDDGDGLVDCEDDDCPCFVDCGGTFVERIGTPGQDEGAVTIIPSGDGNFYIGGYAGTDAAILKMAPDGAVIWQRAFDFSDGDDPVLRLILGDDGYLYGSCSRTHATVFCYDPDNDLVLWSNTITDQGNLRNLSVNPTNGNIMGCGGIDFPNYNISLLAEFDRSTGALNWHREHHITVSTNFYDMEWVGDVLYCPARFTHGPGQDKMRPNITAFQSNGDIAWSKQYITPISANARLYAFCMELASDGLVTGYLGDPSGTDLYNASRTGLFKTDFAGNLQWGRQYELAGYDAVLGAYGMERVDDGYLLYGYGIGPSRDLTVIKTDEEGNALWAMAYGEAGEEDPFYHGGSQILQYGNFIYLVGRSLAPGSSTEDMIIIRASATDGSIPGSDCSYATPIPISTTTLSDAVQNPSSPNETPFSGIAPQLGSVQSVSANLDTTLLCSSSPKDILLLLDTAYCNGDSLAVALRLCNGGTDTLSAGLPFTFYDGNPTADASATILASGFTVTADIPPGECYSTTISVPYPQGQLYCIANDDGSIPPVFNLETDFPPTELIECDYTNNIDSVSYETTVPQIALGPDTSVCENGVFLLDAGPGFAEYRWQDGTIGQTYTTFETGTFWVEATTACGDVSSDTINIVLDTVIAIGLRPDTTICPGASVVLSTPQDPDYTYQWDPSATLDCANCPTVMATPDSTTTYNLVVSNATGCVSIDSVTIMVENCGTILDTAICQGDSLLIEGQAFYPYDMDTIQLADGSSLIVNVSPLDTFYLAISLGVCAGDSVDYEGTTFQAGQSELFSFTTAEGCDSTVEITALQLDTFSTTLDTAICQGQSLDYNGALLQPGQSESFQFTAVNGCDSTVLVHVNPLDTFYLAISLGVCAGDSADYEGIILQAGQSELFSFTTVNGCDSTVEITALQLDTFFTAIDTAVCQGQSITYNGMALQAGQSETFTFTAENGCDSTVLVNVNALDTVVTALEVETCFGEPYIYEGMELPGGSTTPFSYTGSNGCDSTLLLTVTELEDIQTNETIGICQGETGYVFGQPVTEQGIYSETYTSYLGCDSTHNIYFVVQDTAVLNIEPGSLGCGSQSGSLTVEISGATPPYEILWSNGETTATISGLSVGTYSVTVTDAFNCSSVGFQQVYDIAPRPVVDPVGTPAACYGDKDGAILASNPSGGTPPYEYSLDGTQWQPEPLFTGLTAGDYLLFIRDKNECRDSFPVMISQPDPLSIQLPADATLHLGDSIRLAPVVISGVPSFYEWTPPTGLDCASCPAVVARPLESTLYRLAVQDTSGCTGADEVFIDIDRTVRSYLPTAFSPNEDGRNDRFTVFAGPEVEVVQTLQIFSRWGELVFKRDNFAPNDESLGWDGTFRGRVMPAGVYAYFGELVLKDGRVVVVKGEVVLVR